MNKNEIIEVLEDNDISDIQEVKKHEECFILKFNYEFDDIELEGAKECADEECEDEIKSQPWYDEYFLPYLNDTAIDNVNDIIDEISEDYNLDYEMLSFEVSEDSYENMKFLVAFYKENLPVDIDDLILEL